ncbi:MAG: ABC transporter ATP-binding protein [Candidatus Sumerlaeota bacterium]
MSVAVENDPAIKTPRTVVDVVKSPKHEQKRRALTRRDWGTVLRVLHYALPFRNRIMGALFIGLLASMFTSLNLMALIPVLNVMIEQKKEDQLTKIQARIDRFQDDFNVQSTPFEKIRPYFDLQSNKIRYKWTEWIIRHPETAITWMAVALVLAQILKSILEFASKYRLQKSFYLATVRLRTHLYSRCIALDLPSFDKVTSGSLIGRLNNDMRAVKQVFTNAIGDVVLQPFTAFFLLISLLFLNWQLTLIVMAGMPVIVLPITYVGKKLRTMGRKDEEEDARLLDYTQETLQGLMIVKAFTGEGREVEKFSRLSSEMAKRQIRREKFRLFGEPFVEITASMAMAAVLCIGGYFILKADNASMTPPEFLIYLVILSRFYPPIKSVSNMFIKMQKALASADRIFEIIDTPPDIAEKPGALPIPHIQHKVEFRDVSFSYAPHKPTVLRDFSLTIPKGKKFALVGKSGAGKSTVSKLLPRLYNLNTGSIFIDDNDISEGTLNSLRGQIAIVSQDTVLFNDSVFNNISYAKPNATREEVEIAARSAYAHEFIEHLPNGYDTVIGERGNQLSGGQRQRLAIARALLADTPILILDEATSALDPESESIVQRAIERLMEFRTSIVIAHRLSTIRKADEIIVMHDGRIVERGTHHELIAREGRYYELLQQHEFEE